MKTISRLKRFAGVLTLAGGLFLGLNSSFAQSGSGSSSGSSGYGDGSSGGSSSSMTGGGTSDTSSTNSDRGFNLGWIGLLGLAGLFGLKKHHEGYDTHGASARTA